MGDEETWRIRDPVHGLIVFGDGKDEYQNHTDRIALRLLNTPEFQRLRRIRQLGFSDLVYPGATHSRFSHSVGVYHIARQLIDVIRRTGKKHDESFRFNKKKARVALLAALLHDIGHGPLSHVFEQAGKRMFRERVVERPPVHWEAGHETWSARIVQEDTQVRKVLKAVDKNLPEEIGNLLKAEHPKDIYAAVVSSQFDADRLDYLQRDRLMTGVQCGHFDYEWLFNCLEVGTAFMQNEQNDDEPIEVPCLCLNSKGVQVAEEYLEARFRLYKAVYMHKTTRAAEMMLCRLLTIAVRDLQNDKLVDQEPILKYFMSESPDLDLYLGLDDVSVWATLAALAASGCTKYDQISKLAQSICDRLLYKCFDYSSGKGPDDFGKNQLVLRFEASVKDNEALIFEDAEITMYSWYDFDSRSGFNKVLVKDDDGQLEDIASKSRTVIEALRKAEHIWRVYASDREQVGQIRQLWEECRAKGRL